MSHADVIIGSVPVVDWQPWRTAAFLDAQRRRRPVLLLLEVAWAPSCRDAHVHVFTRPDVVAAIIDGTIPVRVDADLRPDIADRYGLGHWPSLLLLTPDGHVLTGGTRLDDTLALRLRSVSDMYRASGPAAHRAATSPPAAEAAGLPADPPVAMTIDDWRTSLADELWRARDPATGAFILHGVPMAGAAMAALARAATTGDASWAEAAAATLALVVASPDATPTDPLAGAAAGTPGGLLRLETLADWIRVLARAVTLMPDPAWAAHLDALVEVLRRDFQRREGQWRPWAGADAVVLVDSAARACRALLAAAEARARPEEARDAIDSVETLALAAYQRGAGVVHVLQHGTPRGPALLDDAMQLAHALLDAEAWRGDGICRDLADELRQTTRGRLQDASGALQDRRAALAGAGQVGRLADASYPLVGNALAILLERRLAGGPPTRADEAVRMLRGIAPQALGAALFAAPLVLAGEALAPAGDVVATW